MLQVTPMPPISPANMVALQVLQQSGGPPAVAARKPAVGDLLLAAANGIPSAASEGPDTSIAAKARITEALFGVNSLDLTKIKTGLFERLGKEFGLSVDDFASLASFGRQIKAAIMSLRRSEEGRAELSRIEKILDLPGLGISIDTVVEAMIDPQGGADDKLEAALLREIDDDDAKVAARLRALVPDEIGLYRF